MVRPLINKGVGQLEELFVKSSADQSVLKQLEHELQNRQMPRAVALLAKVQAAIHSSDPAPAPTVATPSQKSLWDAAPRPTSRPPPEPNISRSPEPVLAPPKDSAITGRAPRQPVADLTLDDAYRLLKATPDATWESIEQTRRLLIHASHPKKLQNQQEEKRAQVLVEAGRVNAAYAMLSKLRCAGR